MSRAKFGMVLGVALLGWVILVALVGAFVSGRMGVEQIATWTPHYHSGAYNGADVSYLQSGNTANSVLSACNVERDGKDVKAQGYNRESDQLFSVWDTRAEGACEANFTGRSLEWHRIKEEGSDYGAKSYH